MGNAYRSVLSLKPTGDALPANVLAGKTFSNADGTGKTGTMANNGAVSVTLTDQDPTYTIPEGYHNGLGVVGFSSSGGDGADLIVTCDSLFAGTTITCTDGTTTFEEICPSTSPYQVVFQSIPIGTWTISGTYSGRTYSTIFTVLNFEATLNAVPDGSTATPTDDIQIWLNCANIWDKTYTSLSEVLADSSTLQTLIASNNAADYMARSSTWVNGVVADSSAMTYIGLNDYCANKLLADSTWLNAICNSTYFESVLNIKVPTMTSDTTPSGVCSGSSLYGSNYHYYYPFSALSSGWCPAIAEQNSWLKYKFTTNVSIYLIKLTIGGIPQSARNYKAQYNDNGNWVDLTNVISLTTGSRDLIANVSNISDEFRLLCTNKMVIDGGGDYAIMTGLQFYGRASS